MCGRVLEKLINVHPLKYLQENSLLCHQQAGFLPSQSTITQLCFLTHKWQTALDKGDNVEAVFLDLCKAYDRVSVPGLIYKLSQTGFSQAALQWFSSFLSSRRQCVQVNSMEAVRPGKQLYLESLRERYWDRPFFFYLLMICRSA